MTENLKGSYGKVKMAIHQLTNQPVAIKIVDRFHAPSVAREIEMWKQLRHPNIAQLYEIIVTESKIYMVPLSSFVGTHYSELTCRLGYGVRFRGRTISVH